MKLYQCENISIKQNDQNVKTISNIVYCLGMSRHIVCCTEIGKFEGSEFSMEVSHGTFLARTWKRSEPCVSRPAKSWR